MLIHHGESRAFLKSNIDLNQTLWQLVMYCFLTGFTSAPTFLACYIWAGFQSAYNAGLSRPSLPTHTPFPVLITYSRPRAAGNLVQLSLAIARLFATSDRTFHKGDQQALTSLISFLLGSSLGRIGDRVGPKKRWWLMTSTFIMALLTMAASLCAHFSGDASVAE